MTGTILDTSVWINVLASGEASQVISVFDGPCLLPDQIAGEVVRDPTTGNLLRQSPHELLHYRGVVPTTLTGRELEIFMDLVSGGSGARLGDGEAAAIAIAAERGLVLALDERKARRAVIERYRSVQLTSSFELLDSSPLRTSIGDARVEDCLRRAFAIGRMHKA